MKAELEQRIIMAAPELFRLAKVQSKWEGPKYPIMFGFECGDGWFNLLYQLSTSIRNYCKFNNKPFPQITQIKEKFGGLRYYYDGGTRLVDGMVWLAESMSESTCEHCGTMENVGQTTGWITTLCEDCFKKTDLKTWKANEI